MNNNINYQKVLEKTLSEIKKSDKLPHLMLHSCCAPCSSYVLEYLNSYFKITVFYYNPNIFPKEEFEFRFEEQKRLIRELGFEEKINVIKGEWETEEFFSLTKGMENEPEGGERCFKCYRQRLIKTAKTAKKYGCDYFCTTLTISPYKNAAKLNEIGKEISEEYNIDYLYSDFKKNNGYKRSIELSKKYNLYRQNYCGCVYSKNTALPKSSSGNENSL